MNTFFNHRNNILHAEDTSVIELAEQFGTPLYVYSRSAFEQHFMSWQQPLGDKGTICYAVKANSNIGVLSLLAKLGSGFDIVSEGELARVIKAGGDPSKIIFSGVGKTAQEIRTALDVGIHCFNVESEAELELLNQVATEKGVKAPVSLRVNPDVDANTHPYISTGLKENKFGIDINHAPRVYAHAAKLSGIAIKGIDCHIGSQITDLEPFWDAFDRILLVVDELESQGIHLEHLDLGGGLGVTYDQETPPAPEAMYQGIFSRLGDRQHQLIFEPGRSIAANAGLLVTRTLFLKPGEEHHFAIVDAAMNDMLRPSLYQAWMRIAEVDKRNEHTPEAKWDIVGPICETGDFLAKQRSLRIEQGDLLAMFSAGAYGFTMSSNYNSRCRAAEVIVSGSDVQLIRERESFDDLVRGEYCLN